MKKIQFTSFLLLLVMLLAGCAGGAEKEKIYKAGEEFLFTGQHWVYPGKDSLPKISNASTGASTEQEINYIFWQKEDRIKSSIEGGQMRSLFKLSFSIGDQHYSTKNFTAKFLENNKDGYKVTISFTFTLPADSPLPEKLTLEYTGSEKKQSPIHIKTAPPAQ